MGTETNTLLVDYRYNLLKTVKLNNPLMGTETKILGLILELYRLHPS